MKFFKEIKEGYYNKRDAYQRDYDSSVAGMGKRQSLAYQLDGGANDEGWDRPEYQPPQHTYYIRFKDTGAVYKQKGVPKSFANKQAANAYAVAMMKNNPKFAGNLLLTVDSNDKTNEASREEIRQRIDATRAEQDKQRGEYKAQQAEQDRQRAEQRKQRAEQEQQEQAEKEKPRKLVQQAIATGNRSEWNMLSPRDKADALYDAGLIEYGDKYDYIRNAELSDKRLQKAILQYQQDQYDLEIGPEKRAEIKAKADELAEERRQQLRKEKLEAEQIAYDRYKDEQERKDAMKKIEMEYKHDLEMINTEHRNNMEAIRTGNAHEINKIVLDHQESQRDREHELNMLRQQQKHEEEQRAQRPAPEVNEPEEDNEDEPEADSSDSEPFRPQAPAGPALTQPTKPGKYNNDDAIDVDFDEVPNKPPKPGKPPQLGAPAKESIGESAEDLPMYGAIIHRIMVAHTDLLAKYGPEKIMSAAQDEAEWVGDVEEIGSSDVSISVKRVIQALQEQYGVKEASKDSAPKMSKPERKLAQGALKGAKDMSAMLGLVRDKDGVLRIPKDKKKGVAKGVATSLPMSDAVKLLKQYGADNFKTTTNELHFYKNGKPFSVDLVMNTDTTRSVTLSSLNSATRGLKGQGVTEDNENPRDVINVDVPMLLRVMEFAREDAQSDVDLHKVAERLTQLSADGRTVTIDDYKAVVGELTNLEEAGMSTGNQGYDNMLAVMKAVDAGQDAHFELNGEPIVLEYPEARFLAGKYKAFLRAGRQEEFLKYMNDPVMFDRLMKQLRDLIDKQKNFKGSVPGERGVEESAKGGQRPGSESPIPMKPGFKPADTSKDDLNDRMNDLGDKEKENPFKKPYKPNRPTNLPPGVTVKESEYWCKQSKSVKLIPEGYKKTAEGYITRK